MMKKSIVRGFFVVLMGIASLANGQTVYNVPTANWLAADNNPIVYSMVKRGTSAINSVQLRFPVAIPGQGLGTQFLVTPYGTNSAFPPPCFIGPCPPDYISSDYWFLSFLTLRNGIPLETLVDDRCGSNPTVGQWTTDADFTPTVYILTINETTLGSNWACFPFKKRVRIGRIVTEICNGGTWSQSATFPFSTVCSGSANTYSKELYLDIYNPFTTQLNAPNFGSTCSGSNPQVVIGTSPGDDGIGTYLNLVSDRGSFISEQVCPTGCFTLNTAGHGAGTVNVQRVWSFSGGFINNGLSLTEAFQPAGQVFALPTVNAGGAQAFCDDTGGVNLTGASPPGGTWVGSNLSGSGVFDTNASAPGAFNVSYSFVDGNGCSNSSTKTITVNPRPSVSAGPAQSFCRNSGNVALTGASPFGGVWSGSTYIVTGGLFDTSAAPSGTYTLTFTATDGVTGCTNSATKQVTIFDRPVVTAGSDFSACQGGSTVTLTGGSPSGGTWSGTNVTGSNFNPVSTGNFVLTYTFTNVNGCTSSSSITATVNAIPSVSAGPNLNRCLGDVFILTGESPAGGTWSGPGVSGNTMSTAVAGLGTKTVTYTVTALGCTGTSNRTVTVNALPTVSAGPNFSVCEGGATMTLTGATPLGGTWSGTGVVGGTFNPVIAGVGPTTLTYSYTDFNGCSATSTRIVTVNALPVVSGGNNLTVCYNAGLIPLNDGTPSPIGGTWSGLGVVGNSFDPVTAGSGLKVVTYTFTNASGCTNQASRQILVRTPSAVSAGNDFTVCLNDAPVNLTGQNPLGGTWSGTAVSGSSFNPTLAGVGNFVISYTVIDGNGCPNIGTRTATVLASPIVSAGGNQTTCVSETALTLTGASPATGGTWSGPTVVGGVFNPALAGVGTFTVTYTFSSGAGCSGSSTKTVTVNALPTVTVPVGFSACVNGANITLTGGLPSGGTWSGPGVTSGQFNPSSAGVGNKVLVYTFTNGSGCTNSAAMNVVVNALPVVSAGIDLGTCANVTNLTLTGASPTGGTWSGVGVTGSNFDATVAGIGTTVVTYTYTDGNGCSTSANRNISVTASPTVIGGTDLSVCLNTTAFTIPGGSPAGGTWSGAGVFTNTFDPGVTGVGVFSLTYTFNNGVGCSGVATKNIQVKSIPVVTAGPSLQFCLNAGNQTLTGGTPTGGVWSGVGVSGNTFNPFTAGVGNQTLTYSFTQNGCTVSATRSVSVFSLPSVSAGSDLSTCVNETALPLTGATPVGGTWAGVGVTGNTFNANSVGIGAYTLTYTFTDGNGCAVSASRQVTVNPLPVVNAGSSFSVCINSAPQLLSGFSPTGGTWTGAGISGNNFNPALAGIGIHTLTYTFSNGNGCTVSATRQVTVNALPIVSGGADLTVCSNGAITNLIGATPVGGSWSGSGIVGSSFNPALVTAGIYAPVYAVTDINGCSSSATKQVIVNAAPVVNAGTDISLCLSDQINLTGATPSGGSWSGAGVTGTVFKASDAGVGTQVITYAFTNASGCSNTDTRNIVVNALPVVSGGGDLVVCINTVPFTVTGGTPGGGTWAGTGVNNNIFSPTLAGVGQQTLTYTFINGQGCTNTATKKITVTALPSVNAGSDLSVCLNTAPFALMGATPSGGTFSGNGVSGGTFNPLASGTGTFTINYSYTDPNGCSGSATRTIAVNALPVVNAGPDLSRCLGDTFTLNGASPLGGTWSGNGVSGTTFTSSVAGLGTTVVTYSFTSAQGCTVSATRQITVNAVPTVSGGSTVSLCKGQSLTLVDGTPAGGSWSGAGVSGNTFNSSFLSPGIYALTYSYTTFSGCTSTAQKQITVNALPTVSAGSDLTLCQNSGVVPLSGASPASGVWSGAGVAGNNFNSSLVSVGAYVVTYTFTDGNGCSAGAFRNVVVNSVPVVAAGNNLSGCLGDVVTLTGESPSGGAWSGLGVSGNTLNSVVAGIGTHTVTYSFTGANGCIGTATRTVTINSLPGVNAGGNLVFCANQTATLTDGAPTGGTWSGPGMVGNIFNALLAGTGIKTLTYTYVNPVTGCSASATRQVTVNALPTVSAGADITVCVNALPVTLTGAAPAGGTWSGTGIAAGVFNPSSAGIGVFVATYSFTNANGCTATATRAIVVNSIPAVSAGSDFAVCAGQTVSLTSASPLGGTWSGVGVTGTSFDSNAAGVGITTVTYTFTSANGCSNTASRNITVNAIPVVSSGTTLVLCTSSPITSITGGSPSGGVWSGTGVSGSSFDPSVGLGTYTITYSFTQNGCTGTANKTVNVVNNPTVSAGGDLSVCVDGGVIAMTGASPVGGVWSGPGISGSNFNPATAGVGTTVVTYTYTQGLGCVGSASRQITVRAKPLVSAGSNTQVCLNATVTLSGATPSGGTWSGANISGNTFTALAVGPQIVTYNFTDANGCSNSATRQIDVLALPTVLAGADQNTCSNAGLLTLTDGTPSGGVWTGTGVSGGRLDPFATGAGTFLVTYTFVNFNGCSNTATKSVVVRNSPTVNPGANITACSNDALIILSGATPAGGAWTGPGVTGTTFNPSLAGVGNQVLTYSFTDINGCTGTAARQALVNPSPLVTAGSGISVCRSQGQVTLTGGNPFGGIWSGPFVNGNTFNATNSGAGTFLVTYTFAAANGCSSSAQREITVNGGPNVNAGPNLETCAGVDPITLSGATPIGGTWSGTGVVGSEFRPKNVSIGSYPVVYSFTDGNNCAATSTRIVTVNALPSVNAGQALTMCVNDPPYNLAIDAAPLGGSFTGTGVALNTSSFNPAIAGTGTFRIAYTFTNSIGCTNTAARDIIVTNGLQAPTVTGADILCYGVPGTYSASAVGANSLTRYRWYLGGEVRPFAEGRTASVTAFEDQTVFVDAINSQGCSSLNRGEKNIRVERVTGSIKVSKINASTGDPVQFEWQGTPAATFNWDFGDGTVGMKNKMTHFYYAPGNYDIKLDLTTANNCIGSYLQLSLVRISGTRIDVVTADNAVEEKLSVYPVPFNNELFLSIESAKTSSCSYIISSLTGQTLIEGKSDLVIGNNVLVIPTDGIVPAMYLLQVKRDDKTEIKKIVKQ